MSCALTECPLGEQSEVRSCQPLPIAREVRHRHVLGMKMFLGRHPGHPPEEEEQQQRQQQLNTGTMRLHGTGHKNVLAFGTDVGKLVDCGGVRCARNPGDRSTPMNSVK